METEELPERMETEEIPERMETEEVPERMETEEVPERRFCSICQDNIETAEEELITLPCLHHYHIACWGLGAEGTVAYVASRLMKMWHILLLTRPPRRGELLQRARVEGGDYGPAHRVFRMPSG
ncbi:hypothetical protein HK104_000629 [Borealophlyctis nickersoniae]|nr:hypothetical protein HK104_000629 [Borealophlyctis nickersoniae]